MESARRQVLAPQADAACRAVSQTLTVRSPDVGSDDLREQVDTEMRQQARCPAYADTKRLPVQRPVVDSQRGGMGQILRELRCGQPRWQRLVEQHQLEEILQLGPGAADSVQKTFSRRQDVADVIPGGEGLFEVEVSILLRRNGTVVRTREAPVRKSEERDTAL